MAIKQQPADIGIDLGTTFSVIAIKGKLPPIPNAPSGTYLENIDVTILPGPNGDLTIPSVLWIEPATGRTLIGGDARQKTEEGFSPIMFSKRSIGTNEPLRINDRTLTAKEVATEILKHLKVSAESILQCPVRRAVVTHPAYFDTNQIQDTREAAIAAGFDMSRSEQLLMEPTAAALAYLQTEDRDPLTVMTYDLGGGTFDVTILRRQEADTQIIAHDGDPLLGGFNFDRALVEWLRKRQIAKGRELAYDENKPEDRGRYARLLHLAESVKIKLSQQHNRKSYVPINARDMLVDDQGRPVEIIDRINCDEFATLIKDYLDDTILCCRRAIALAKQKVPDLTLDAILFVGGSTYGPWVADAVRDALQMNGEQYEPDLCVAAGAAIQAAKLPRVVAGANSLELLLESSTTSLLPTTTIAGRLQGKSLTPNQISTMTVRLSAEKKMFGPLRPTQSGAFSFVDVPLTEVGSTPLKLEVHDSNGNILLSESFAVQYNPTESTTEVWTVLPKSLFIQTANGMRLVAEQGQSLPTQEYEIDLQRIHSDDNVMIPVYQEDALVGKVMIDRIPPEAGPGSPVKLKLRVSERNQLNGTATVLTRGGTVAAQCAVNLMFPPIEIPTLTDLEAWFQRLEDQRQQLQYVSDDAEQRAMLGGVGNKMTQKIQELFGQMQPDKQAIFREVRKLERLLTPPREELQPPRSQFRWKVAACRAILCSQPGNPELESYEPQIARIEKEGNEAYTARNQRKWTATNQNITRIHHQLEEVVKPAPPKPDSIPTALLKEDCRERIADLREKLAAKDRELKSNSDYEQKFNPRCAQTAAAINKLTEAVETVPDDLDPNQARGKLYLIMKAETKIAEDISKLHVDLEQAGASLRP